MSAYTEIKSGIQIEICQVRGRQCIEVEEDYSTETLTSYNRCTVTVNNKKLNNHKSVSMSNHKTINNINVYLLSGNFNIIWCTFLYS